MRRTYASTSSVRSAISGSGMIEAVIVLPVRVTDVAPGARDALDDHLEAAGRPRHLPDDADRADRVQVRRLRVVGLGRLQRRNTMRSPAEARG